MESWIVPGHSGRIHRSVLYCGHGPLGPAVLLRLHGAAVWLDARASHFGERTEQTGGGAVVRVFRRMDGGPLRAAEAYAGGNFDGGRGVDRTGKHLDAGHVLFFLHAECVGVRLRRAAAKPGAIVALVRTISRESDGVRVFGNRVGRRGGAVDFAHSGAAFWLASGASNAGAFDSGDCTSRGVADERALTREKEHSEYRIRGDARRVCHASFF